MANKDVTIINTGCANISSVKFALQRLGANVTISSDAKEITKAPRLVLPGVGSAPAAMQSIAKRNLTEVIQQLTQPVLGVCLGMQIMVESSEENDLGNTENTPCLQLMSGQVNRMKVGSLRLPHMGWNQVTKSTNSPLFDGLDDGTYFYFVHSFAVPKYDNTIATCDYGPVFSAAIQHDNFYGVQFHPERSSDAGAQVLRNFMSL
ncbi:MAG: imidazole glycerol phosphate synthase subunit HisH [Pseudomonadota bacterium]